MESERCLTPISTTNSSYGDTVGDEQTEQYFTEREMEQVLKVADELDRMPASPPRGLTQVKITSAIIIALMAIIMFQYLRLPAAVEQPSASFLDAGGVTMPRRAIQDQAASRFAESLRGLRDSIQPLEDLYRLADKVALAANNSAISNSKASKDAVEALLYVPRVLQRTTKDLKAVTKFGNTIDSLLQESLGMVESEVMRVPKDAGAALTLFRHTLDRLRLKLDSVFTLIDDITLRIEESFNLLMLTRTALEEVAQALEGEGGRPSNWLPFFGSSGHKNELAWLQELSSEMTAGALSEMENAAKLFSKYAEMLRVAILVKVHSQNTKIDERWVNVVVLETWMKYGQSELVGPQVLRNLKTLFQLLEEVQIG